MLVSLIVRAAEEDSPPAEDVVAGWTGFAVFVGLILAVVVIAFFLVRSLRKVDKAEDAGLYDHKPTRGTTNGATNGAGPAEKSD